MTHTWLTAEGLSVASHYRKDHRNCSLWSSLRESAAILLTPQHIRAPHVPVHHACHVQRADRPDHAPTPLLPRVLRPSGLSHTVSAPREKHHVDNTDPEVVIVRSLKPDRAEKDGNTNTLQGFELIVDLGLVLQIPFEFPDCPLADKGIAAGKQADLEQDPPRSLLAEWHDTIVQRLRELFAKQTEPSGMVHGVLSKTVILSPVKRDVRTPFVKRFPARQSQQAPLSAILASTTTRGRTLAAIPARPSR